MKKIRAKLSVDLVCNVLFGFLSVLILVISIRSSNYTSHNKFGDSHTLMNVMYASKVFAEKGFLKSAMTPLIPMKFDGVCCSEEYYTHFTPLPYYLGGIIWKFGGNGLEGFRLIGILSGILFLIFVYLTLKELKNSWVALIITAFIPSSYVFWSVHLTQVMNLASLFFMFSFYLVVLHSKGKVILNEKVHLSLIFLSSFLNFFSTFEMIFFGQVAISTFLLIYCRRFFWKVSLTVGVSYILAFVTKMVFSSWALGGVSNAFKDLLKSFLWRTIEADGSTNYFQELAGGYNGYPAYLLKSFQTHFFLNKYVLLLMVIIPILLYINKNETRIKEEIKSYLSYILIFFLAALSWALIFPQHNVIHINSLTIRHWQLFYSCLMGGMLVLGILTLRSKSIMNLTLGSFLIMISLVNLGLNVKKMVKSLKHTEDFSWIKELEVYKELTTKLDSGSLIYTTDPAIEKINFLHRPVEVFDLKNIKVKYIKDLSELKFKNNCIEKKCFILPYESNSKKWVLSELN